MQEPSSTDHNTHTERIIARAHTLGFDHAIIAPASPLLRAQEFDDWIAEGRHGAMSYLDRHHELRRDPQKLEPGTRSIIVVLKNYNQPTDRLSGGARIARYAHGDDYHNVLRERLRELASFIHAETGAAVGARPAVDSAPLLERSLAQQVGLGWIGKNSMLIHPKIGSFTFIAELLIATDLEATTTTTPNRCGRCTRCIDACPTQAIISPYILDARRCISYLTIELREPIPRTLRPLIGDHLFGCDICQDVCPWNSKAKHTHDPSFATRKDYTDMTPEDVLLMDQSAFSSLFRQSPIKRTKRRGLARNAAVVLGNRRDPALLPLLMERLEHEPEPLVRGHIAWAIARSFMAPHDETYAASYVASFLHTVCTHEESDYVREELRDAIDMLAHMRSKQTSLRSTTH